MCHGYAGVRGDALEELMCRIMGSLVMEGSMAKIADDMYIGGNLIPKLADNWERFLSLLVEYNLGISAPKTKIAYQVHSDIRMGE